MNLMGVNAYLRQASDRCGMPYLYRHVVLNSNKEQKQFFRLSQQCLHGIYMLAEAIHMMGLRANTCVYLCTV